VTEQTLVVDASVAIAASHSPVGFAALRRFQLVAPQLLWFEAPSVMHEMAWRGQISGKHAAAMLGRLLLTLDERLIRGIARLELAIRPRDL
jgi:hypothetical protein